MLPCRKQQSTEQINHRLSFRESVVATLEEAVLPDFLLARH